MKLLIYLDHFRKFTPVDPRCCRENDAVSDPDGNFATQLPVHTVLAGMLKRRWISPVIRLLTGWVPTRVRLCSPPVRPN